MNYEELLNHVNDYFSDTSRSQESCLDDFKSIISEIEILIECLESDIQNRDD